MDSTWNRSNITYYVAKALGFLPFAGNTHKTIELLYSLILWIFFGLSGVHVIVFQYRMVSKAKTEYRMLMKVRYSIGIFATVKRLVKDRKLLELCRKF